MKRTFWKLGQTMNVRMQTETIGRDETKLSYVYGQAGVTADLGQKYLVLTF